MPTLSIAIIAHNEEQTIGQTLASVQWAEQVVVVDCESSDSTAVIANQAGASVHREPNHSNLNINKNKAIELCMSDWILVLDADETIPDACAGEIRMAIDTGGHEGFQLPRRNYTLGKWLRRGSQYPDYQLRLFRRTKGLFPADHIHERIEIDGSIGTLREPYDHHPYPDMATFVRKNLRDAEFEANYLIDSGRRIDFGGLLSVICFKIPARFFRRYVLKGGFLDGAPGLIRAWFDGFNMALRWSRLWELSRNDRSRGAEE